MSQQQVVELDALGGHVLLDSVEPISARKLAHSALDAFFESGYGGTTTRIISQHAGMSTGALYTSFKSKEQILFEISRIGHQSALDVIREAAEHPGSATERVREMVYHFTIWHAQNYMIARVSQYELAALEPGHYAIIAGLRNEIGAVLRAEVERGVKSQDFDVEDIHGSTLAALSLGIDVARWFTPGGRQQPEDLANSYAALVMRMLKAS